MRERGGDDLALKSVTSCCRCCLLSERDGALNSFVFLYLSFFLFVLPYFLSFSFSISFCCVVVSNSSASVSGL